MSKICLPQGDTPLRYVEMDPSRRYGRFKDVLGKGAMKTVYRAFDEHLGIEVAWNQVKLNEVFKSSEEMRRVYSEVHLLKDLDHTSIMKFFASWTDGDRRTFNFITEMFTSGTLRGYRKKYKNVSLRTIKNWARQILKGLEYLHGHDPPVIHRDLKCDNIFVNGHLGQIKIGDLGLGTILLGSKHAHSVIGTPEFMAPELYEEDYDELVDIYSFGMCILEMLTLEYPYGECSNPAQIYKKVTSGKLPAAYYKIEDMEARSFIGRCLGPASSRPSARELLNDPFLSTEQAEDSPFPLLQMDFLNEKPKKSAKKTKMSITGAMNDKDDDDAIFLKVQICDQDGKGSRNIYFPFDIATDTAFEVATEMVKELDITDWEAIEIASLIDEEVTKLFPSLNESRSEIYRGQSFDYADEDNNDENHSHQAYYTSSSGSSSQTSLTSLFSPREFQNFQGNSLRKHWIQDGTRINDDVNYNTSSEKLHRIQKALKGTILGTECENGKNRNAASRRGRRSEQKLTRTESLVDLRSKLLHQKLVEEINKRRLFQTVGVVEDIGFQDPSAAFAGENSRPRRE